ncbi:DNA repair protein RAD16 [Aspergillus tanneri]|uniref:DNA repair protein rad16 n=1 Tax=Aspergillus tanneri TaxID=1220188 RepID=A0A5M9M9Y2_9EURO|nr:DNA repair protein rad16 [Aspergillus tanneri]KAA8642144.1 DNA repair protein rad16 [Aspergillus tanneri]
MAPNSSTSLPRRTSLRLAQSSSISTPAKKVDQTSTNEDSSASIGTVGSHQGNHRSASLEVAIPLKKHTPHRSPSASTSTEESNIPGPKKRVSASARARELRSSTMSLNPQRRRKTALTVNTASDSASEASDAALARALQIEEYQSLPSKRRKVSEGIKSEIKDSDDDSILTELESDDNMGQGDFKQWQPPRKSRTSLRSARKPMVANSEDSTFSAEDMSEEDDSSSSDFGSNDQTSSNEGMPSVIQRGSRNRNATNTRRRARNRRQTTRGSVALKERKKLEKQHPYVTKMWEDLKNAPPITPVAAAQPSSISRTLKSFQLEGLYWMMQQEKSQYKGGLLGDEMGMGKTIQAVSLLMSDYPIGKPSLVVVPPVALMQWQSEIKEYTNGQLKVLVYHNSNSKVKGLSKKDLQAYDVIMISYSGLESIHRKEWKGWNRNDGIVKEDSVIHSIHYHRLILDEAHSIKQRTTSVARACFALKANYKWCLSGTPVQNRIGEFFSLLRFLEVRPFACYFCKQCKCQQLHWSQDAEKRCTECRHSGFSHVSIFNQEILNPITERDHPEARKEALSKLRLITDRIMLRRVKKDHTASMELPPKRVVLHNEFFGEIERDFSRSIMTNSSRQFDTYVSRGVMLNNYANIFGLIMQMRQVANHPDLILKKHAESGQNVLVCSICDEPAEEAIRSRCHHEFCRRCAKDYIQSFDADTVVDCPRCHIPLSIDFEQPDIEQEEEYIKKNSIINRIRMDDWTSSTKIEMLVYDLYKLRSKKQTHKSIVFSQFTSMLQLVEWRLRRAGFNTVMLDGTMTPAQRQRSIDYFMNNVDVEVFLVSLKAGGVALNLTEASRVFIVDPWWNPAAEWQSADRCHRIGQRRPCVITRLCIEDSVESRIVLLQEKKANMIRGTINKDQGEALEKLTPEDMQFLFRGS